MIVLPWIFERLAVTFAPASLIDCRVASSAFPRPISIAFPPSVPASVIAVPDFALKSPADRIVSI